MFKNDKEIVYTKLRYDVHKGGKHGETAGHHKPHNPT